MADRTPMEDVMRRAFDANVRYWETVGRAATDYVQTVTRIWSDAPVSWKTPSMSWTAPRAETVRTADPVVAPALVLEGVAGTEVRAVLMISNDLTREAAASVQVSTLRGPDGRFASVEVRAAPESLTLAAGARVPVTLLAEITEALHVDTDYHGEVTVPGLSARGVPIVVRRRAG
jgi:hypothetical protein